MLDHRDTPPADVLIKGAHVLDPRTGLDAAPRRPRPRRRDRRDRRPTSPHDGEVIDGEGKHLFPGFVDPHVHLRVPGQEHKEDLETGTRSAAAGGFVAVVAMPNTSPTVDSAPILRSLREAARREARVPVGFLACVTHRPARRGADRDGRAASEAGALGFTDDGKPVHRAGLLRKALQYQKLVGGIIALHEEDPTLSGNGVMHEGEVSARLGLAGIPSISESTLIARDAAIARYEDGRIHIQHLSARESVEADRRGQGARREDHLRGQPAPPHADRRGAAGAARHAAEDEPAAALRGRPPGADRRPADGTIDCIATDHAPHAREEKEVPFEEAPMGTTGLETAFAAVYTDLVKPGRAAAGAGREKLSAGAALMDLPTPKIEVGKPADLVLIDLDAQWEVGEAGYESRSRELLLRRPHAARQGRHDDRRRRDRLPRAVAARVVPS